MSGAVFGPGGPGPASPWSVISRASLGDHVPVAGLLRVSTEDLQDPRGSLLRQVGNCVRALPAGWTVVAWFIDIESGRMELDQRGAGTAHLNIDLPVDRDGGLPDLLAEAKRPGCRFAAVICENAERLARYTYFNTKIEYELGKAGIELFASDEPIDPEGKKAAKVLVRRIKQAVGEWTAINTFEMAWDGLKTHTESGYNIGRAPYGYRTQPVSDGTRTKSVLVTHDKEGPVVTQIFRWRIDHRLNNRQIVVRLNKDLTRYPPPTPVRKTTAVGRWTRYSVRNILANPKYTGHMVWNRTTTRTGVTVQRKRNNRPNPTDQWVWSPQPTHPALISLEDFNQAATITAAMKGNRNTDNSSGGKVYVLRGLIRHQQCGQRMKGTNREHRTYYGCHGPRDSANRPQIPDHPGAVYVREDVLLPAIHTMIAERVFGSQRREHLAVQHDTAPAQAAREHAEAINAAQAALADITTRQDNIAAELEETPAADRAWRTRLRDRFNTLETQRVQAAAHLAHLFATQPATPTGNPALLDAMPYLPAALAELPAALQRDLYDVLNLEITLINPRHANIKITLVADTATRVNAALTTAPNHDPSGTVAPAASPVRCSSPGDRPALPPRGQPSPQEGSPLGDEF